LQQLHLVGVTTDHDALIFSARKGAKSGGFLVALNDTLYDTIDEAARERDGDDAKRSRRRTAPRPESALSPRDIQMRLRAGRSIASVASEAGVDEDWVMRFAVPILAEQAQVIRRAQGMTFSKARLGASGRSLGEAVWWNIADKGALMTEDTFDGCWSAHHMRDTTWIVRFDYVNRKRRQRAEWEIDTRDGTLVARNRLGSELGYIEPGRRGKPPAPLPPPVKPAPKRAAPAKVATVAVPAKRAAKKRPAAKKQARKAGKKRPAAKKRPVGTRAAKKRAPAKKSAAKRPAKKATRKTTTRKATARKAAPRKRAPAKRVAKRTPAKRTAAKRTAAKRPTAKRPAAKRTPAKRTAKRPAAKRPAAKRAAATRSSATRRPPRRRPLTAPDTSLQAPAFDGGEPTRPVTIRAARASGTTEPEPAPVVDAAPDAVVEEAPLPPPPVLTSTPTPSPRRDAPPARRFGRLRRRPPSSG
jgi:hypothetical protein